MYWLNKIFTVKIVLQPMKIFRRIIENWILDKVMSETSEINIFDFIYRKDSATEGNMVRYSDN